MQDANLYDNAHLFVAAIRVLTYLHSTAPSVEEICEFLSFSSEQGHLISRKLSELEIIDVVEGSYGARLFVKNHLRLEQIQGTEEEDGLLQELRKFQADQKEKSKKLESLHQEHKAKQKNRFSDLEKKLQEEIKKKDT